MVTSSSWLASTSSISSSLSIWWITSCWPFAPFCWSCPYIDCDNYGVGALGLLGAGCLVAIFMLILVLTIRFTSQDTNSLYLVTYHTSHAFFQTKINKNVWNLHFWYFFSQKIVIFFKILSDYLLCVVGCTIISHFSTDCTAHNYIKFI